MISVYKMILSEEFKAQTKSKRDERKQINDQINQLNTPPAKARNLLLNEAIDASDYRLIKNETENKTQRLEAKLASCPNDHFSINGLIDKALNAICHLDQLYENSDIISKREIISSMFPEKITFDGFNYRTKRVNEAVELIFNLDKGFSENKKGQNENFFKLSSEVTPQVHFSNYFIEDLKRLANLLVA